MNWMLTTIICVLLIEIVVHLPLPAVLSQISVTGRKAAHILGAKAVSDHWKEKILLAYAGTLFGATITLAGYLLVIGAIVVLLIFVADLFGATVGDFFMSWMGIGFSIVVATLYLKARKYFHV